MLAPLRNSLASGSVVLSCVSLLRGFRDARPKATMSSTDRRRYDRPDSLQAARGHLLSLATVSYRGPMSNEDFKARGFLADMSQWRGNVHKIYPEAFAIAYRMNDMGMRMLWELPAGQQNPTDEQAWAVTGYARAIEAFQSSIVMVKHGAMAEARASAPRL